MFSVILQALAYQGIFVVAWVGIALAHILSQPATNLAPDDNKAVRREGISAWFVAAGCGIALLESGGLLASFSAPATALVSFGLYRYLQQLSQSRLATAQGG
ncbi:hypothetical protein D3C72_1898220 [compost metagenome]